MHSYYERAGDGRFRSLPSTAGPWGPDHQHAGPPTALLVREIERTVAPGGDQRFASVQADLLGPVPVAELEVCARVLRPGSRVQLAEAVARAGEQELLHVRAWLVRPTPEDLPPVPDPQPPAAGTDPVPQDLDLPGMHLDGYMRSVDWSFEHGGLGDLGPARAQVRPRTPLLAGEPLTGWQRALIAADSASGISMAHRPDQYPAINCDLHVALHRDPTGEWLTLDAQTRSTPGAGAVTTAELSDRHGTVGTSTQALFLSQRSG